MEHCYRWIAAAGGLVQAASEFAACAAKGDVGEDLRHKSADLCKWARNLRKADRSSGDADDRMGLNEFFGHHVLDLLNAARRYAESEDCGYDVRQRETRCSELMQAAIELAETPLPELPQLAFEWLVMARSLIDAAAFTPFGDEWWMRLFGLAHMLYAMERQPRFTNFSAADALGRSGFTDLERTVVEAAREYGQRMATDPAYRSCPDRLRLRACAMELAAARQKERGKDVR